MIAFDPQTGAVRRTVRESASFVPGLAVADGGLLAIPDRSPGAPGLCLYRIPAAPEDPEVALGCAPLPVPPFALLALDGAP